MSLFFLIFEGEDLVGIYFCLNFIRNFIVLLKAMLQSMGETESLLIAERLFYRV